MSKAYLGDSVYAEVVRGMLRLTTENGYGPTNEIYLEPEVYTALVAYVEQLKARHATEEARIHIVGAPSP